MIKGFFFDLDGTLVDTHRANYEAYHHAILDVGVDISFEAFMKTIGHQAQTFLPWLVPGLPTEEYLAIAERKAKYYMDLVHTTVLNTKLVSFMDLMKDRQLVLVTTAKQKNAKAVLEHHDLGKYFDHVITDKDVEHAKPAPDPYLLALKKTGLSKGEVLAFEDSEIGRKSAEAAGIPVVMINSFGV